MKRGPVMKGELLKLLLERRQARRSSSSVNSDQLELELNDVRLKIPWGGRSPRSLTKCGKLFILSERPTGGSIWSAIQYILFLKGNPNGS